MGHGAKSTPSLSERSHLWQWVSLQKGRRNPCVHMFRLSLLPFGCVKEMINSSAIISHRLSLPVAFVVSINSFSSCL